MLRVNATQLLVLLGSDFKEQLGQEWLLHVLINPVVTLLHPGGCKAIIAIPQWRMARSPGRCVSVQNVGDAVGSPLISK